MKKLLFLIALCIMSCKQNNYEYDDSPTDTSAVSVNEFVIDSTALPTTEIVEELPVRELTYEEAMATLSIYELKDFIKKNPNHENIDNLKSKLIDLEVNLIMNDEKTGKMPISDKISNSNSSSSEVSIKNDTSCELEVRYSGKNSKMISIPAGQSASISLRSGNYRVTASACGENYAGIENLSGNYSSSYYISTTYR